MSGVVLNSRFLAKLLTSGKEDIERVSMAKEDISSIACELTMFILSIFVTFNVTCLTVTACVHNLQYKIFNYEIMSTTLANIFLFILQDSALADLRYGGSF